MSAQTGSRESRKSRPLGRWRLRCPLLSGCPPSSALEACHLASGFCLQPRPPKSSATRPQRQGLDARSQSWSWARQDDVAIGRWLKETVTTPKEAAHAEAKVLLEAGPEFCGGTVDWKDMETLNSRIRSGFRKSKELSRQSGRRGGGGTTVRRATVFENAWCVKAAANRMSLERVVNSSAFREGL